MFEIEKNVPLTGTIYQKYPFKDMEVGDSFRVETEQKPRVTSAANMVGVRNNMKFSVKKHDGAYRCWRIA